MQWSIERIANKISRIARENPKQYIIVSDCGTSCVLRIASLRFFSLHLLAVPISAL